MTMSFTEALQQCRPNGASAVVIARVPALLRARELLHNAALDALCAIDDDEFPETVAGIHGAISASNEALLRLAGLPQPVDNPANLAPSVTQLPVWRVTARYSDGQYWGDDVRGKDRSAAIVAACGAMVEAGEGDRNSIEIVDCDLVDFAKDHAAELLAALQGLLPEIDSEIEQRQHGGNDEDWSGLQSLSDTGSCRCAGRHKYLILERSAVYPAAFFPAIGRKRQCLGRHTKMTDNASTVAADITALLRARNPLLWIVTREEARAEQYLFEAAAAAGYRARTWDVAAGVREMDGGLDAVGGPDVLKGWLASRKSAYSVEARAYGLPAPKGALLVGAPGCGKSLTAKAIATAWGVPLLRVDLGALKSKFVGESESNLRKAFQVIGAIGRCVVWLDEIEKALAGATQGAADGGVSSDALGAILSWMQERQGEAFVIATANDVSSLPPELLRKGRFDELWFVDLPNREERTEVLKAALRSHNRPIPDYVADVANVTVNFTGAEIAALVPDALYIAFADGMRDVTADDLIAAAGGVVPLSSTAAEKIDALRAWAKGRARAATSVLAATVGDKPNNTRALDL